MARGHNNPRSHSLFLSPIAPATSGGSLDLANGQIALVNLDERTSRGARVLPNLSGISNKVKLAIDVGNGRTTTAGMQHNGNFRTHTFHKDDILDVTYSVALQPTYSSVTLGYNGVAGTGIQLEEKQATTVSLTLQGEALSYLGYQNGEAHMLFTLFSGNPEDCSSCATPCSTTSCKDITTNLVERIREHELRTGSFANTGASVKVGDIIEVIPNFSCVNRVTPTGTYTYYTLTLQDEGTLEAMGIVQAQYPDEAVTRIDREGITSVYQIISSSAPSDFDPVTPNELLLACDDCPTGYTASTSGGFVYDVNVQDGGADISTTLLDAAIGVSDQAGAVYTFENLGAADALRSLGTYTGVASSASGAGSGATFTVVVGAGGAVTSLTVVNEGSGYVVGETITIVDAVLGGGGAADFTFDVASLATQSTSVTNYGNTGGVGKYVVVFPTELTQDQIDALVGTDTSLTVDALGEQENFCVPDTQPADVAWVSGETCTVASKQYYIDLRDTDCEVSRLADLQAAFPDLTITEDTDTEHENCRRRFVTTVTSNVVCEGCETPEYLFEAPDDFEYESWHEVPAADGELTSFTYIVGGSFGTLTPSTTNDVTSGITTSGSGAGATFQVIIDGSGDAISAITITSAGSGYAVGDTITIAGDQLSGGSTPADDITLTITGVSGEYPDDCECGITFKAKEGFLCPDAKLAESVGVFTPKGVKIQVSGGEAPSVLMEGYKFITTPFKVTRDGRDFDGTGWGVHLMDAEKAQSERFLGITPTRNYGEAWLSGFETKLEPCSQYDRVTVNIKREMYAGMNSQRFREDIRYIFHFDSGDVCKYAAFFNELGGDIVCP